MAFEQSTVQRLIDLSAKIGVELMVEEAQLLLNHLQMVIEANEHVNLTAVRTVEDGLITHIVDSLTFSNHIKPRSRFVDIGTGAGYPGIPIAITTGSTGTLIDSIKKKTTNLSSIVDAIGIESVCHIECARAEAYALNHKESFDTVVARAVAPLNVLLEYACPLLIYGGNAVFSKGHIDSYEWEAAIRAASIVGFENVSRETIELPEDAGHREIVTFQRVYESDIKLPRRVGIARKRPLGV